MSSIHASKARANTVLRTMAAIWSDHPGYRAEWAPHAT